MEEKEDADVEGGELDDWNSVLTLLLILLLPFLFVFEYKLGCERGSKCDSDVDGNDEAALLLWLLLFFPAMSKKTLLRSTVALILQIAS